MKRWMIMTIKEVVDYIMYSPYNTNPVILRQMLIKLVEDSKKCPYLNASSSIFNEGVIGDLIFGE
jgi:hypothetical protein